MAVVAPMPMASAAATRSATARALCHERHGCDAIEVIGPTRTPRDYRAAGRSACRYNLDGMTRSAVRSISLLVACATIAAAPRWTPQTSGVTATLRGVSAVTDT